MSDLATQFEQAAKDVHALSERPDNDTLLRLYGLYKQGAEGDVSGPKPGFFDFVGTAKYEAWAKIGRYRPGRCEAEVHRPGQETDRVSAARQPTDDGTPDPTTHPRCVTCDVQHAGRTQRHHQPYRRRARDQPGQPVLPLPQQGRHHRAPVRGLRSADGCCPRRAQRPPARPRRRLAAAAPGVRVHLGLTASCTATWSTSSAATAACACASHASSSAPTSKPTRSCAAW